MTLCIAGKNDIAVQALRTLAPLYPVIALPNPDDDGVDGWQPSFRRAADALDVPITSLEELYPRHDVTFLSLEYSQIIRPARFATNKLFNVHFSLLPHYRGCNTSIWPILNEETEHGVTLHSIDPGIDTGPIIAQRSFDLLAMTAFESYMRCQSLGLELVLEWIDRLVAGDYDARPQGEGTTFPRSALDYHWAEIDPTEPPAQIVRRLRAFTFPAFQRPTYRGSPIYRWSLDAFAGSIEVGGVFLSLEEAS